MSTDFLHCTCNKKHDNKNNNEKEFHISETSLGPRIQQIQIEYLPGFTNYNCVNLKLTLKLHFPP